MNSAYRVNLEVIMSVMIEKMIETMILVELRGMKLWTHLTLVLYPLDIRLAVMMILSILFPLGLRL